MTTRYTDDEWLWIIKCEVGSLETNLRSFHCPRLGSKAFGQLFDHTNLKLDATPAQIDQLCSEARVWNFKTVCVRQNHVARCVRNLSGSDVKVACVVGFHEGTHDLSLKVKEANHAIKAGAAELDIVIDRRPLKKGRYSDVFNELATLRTALPPPIVLKIIFETSDLSPKQIAAASVIARAARFDMIKTSTGFHGRGASIADIRTMRAIADRRNRSGSTTPTEVPTSPTERGRLEPSRTNSRLAARKSHEVLNRQTWLQSDAPDVHSRHDSANPLNDEAARHHRKFTMANLSEFKKSPSPTSYQFPASVTNYNNRVSHRTDSYASDDSRVSSAVLRDWPVPPTSATKTTFDAHVLPPSPPPPPPPNFSGPIPPRPILDIAKANEHRQTNDTPSASSAKDVPLPVSAASTQPSPTIGAHTNSNSPPPINPSFLRPPMPDRQHSGSSTLSHSRSRSLPISSVLSRSALNSPIAPWAMGVKASGGIRTLADAIAMVEAGATRLGCSAGVAIMKEARERHDAMKRATAQSSRQSHRTHNHHASHRTTPSGERALANGNGNVNGYGNGAGEPREGERLTRMYTEGEY